MSAPRTTSPSRYGLILLWAPAIIGVCALMGAAIAAGTVMRAVRGLTRSKSD
jgi:hypothetical protein